MGSRNVTLPARHSENPGKHEGRFPGIPGSLRLFSEVPGTRLLGDVPTPWASSGLCGGNYRSPLNPREYGSIVTVSGWAQTLELS